ncbi:MAG TPA: hypothetical protein VI454_19810 [Verrucomicrobiae bacterium]|jgi:hypothetical protein
MNTTYLLFILAATITAIAETTDKTPTPTEIYQEFLVAIVKGDTSALERLAITNKDLAVLTSNPIPPEYREKAIADIKARPYRVLKVGEVFRLRNGKTLSPSAESEKKGWVMIASDVDPVPHMLLKVGKDWKVDAGDLIAARKAAAKRKQ